MIVKPSPAKSKMMVYEQLDEFGVPTGRKAVIEGVRLKPLNYRDLDGLKLDGPINIPLSFSGARIVQTDFLELQLNEVGDFSTPLKSHFSSKAIGLIRGGWLPSGLALDEDMVVLPDRCTVSDLASRYRAGTKIRGGDDFLDLFQGKPVRINPGLFALEGNGRRPPCPAQVWDQWSEAKRKIQIALPEAQITQAKSVVGLIGMLNEMREALARKVGFLRMVVPRLQAPVSARKREEIWHWVLETADDCILPRNSLVVLAALSIACSANGSGPAKRLIKPSATYSDGDAYNALADLRALEVLINLFAAFPQERIMLCTRDRDLSLFWAGLRASGFCLEAAGVTYTLSPVEDLLPNVSPNMLEAYLTTRQAYPSERPGHPRSL